MKKVVCGLFHFEPTPTGMCAVFENLVPFAKKLVFKSEPFSYHDYISFLNSELSKLKKEEPVNPNTSPVITTHSKRGVCLDFTNPKTGILYRCNPMKYAVWQSYFTHQFEAMHKTISEL